jgi:hypothetical protein
MQGINVFASTAARDAAITSPQEGQFAYTKDTNSLWYYTGSAWAASGATGDIEGVTAGVGITGGGTSGTVTITNDMATTITAAGDIVVGTGNGTYDNLPIGTTAQVLTADTTVSPYKVKWATPASGGGITLISTTALSGASVTLSSIPQTYLHLQIYIASATNDTADGSFRIGINGANNYAYFVKNYKGTAGNEDAGWVAPNNTYTRTNSTNFQHYNIYNYATDTGWKTFDGAGGFFSASDYKQFQNGGYIYTAGAALSSLVLSNSGGNFSGGTVYLYGVK